MWKTVNLFCQTLWIKFIHTYIETFQFKTDIIRTWYNFLIFNKDILEMWEWYLIRTKYLIKLLTSCKKIYTEEITSIYNQFLKVISMIQKRKHTDLFLTCRYRRNTTNIYKKHQDLNKGKLCFSCNFPKIRFSNKELHKYGFMLVSYIYLKSCI